VKKTGNRKAGTFSAGLVLVLGKKRNSVHNRISSRVLRDLERESGPVLGAKTVVGGDVRAL